MFPAGTPRRKHSKDRPGTTWEPRSHPGDAAPNRLRYGDGIAGLQKVAIVGAGSVGAAVAYASMIDGVADEIALYDVSGPRATAEVLDLRHGLQFVGGGHVSGGDDIAVCAGADVVVVTAGAKQDPGQTRLELAGANVRVDPPARAATARRRTRGHLAAGDEPGRRHHVRRPGDLRTAATSG